MTSLLLPSSLWIEPWCDLITEQSGHDPRSQYVERFWLGVIGPTAAWLMRYVADEFDSSPEGFELPVADASLQLGISPKSGNSGGIHKTLHRLVMFRLAAEGHSGYAVRRRLPPLNHAQLRRLPTHLQRSHASYCSLAEPAAGVGAR